MTEPIQKYNIERDFKEKLKVFFMIVRPATHPPIQGERAIGIVAYRPEDAMRKAKELHGIGASGLTIISYGDHVLVEELLSNVNMPGVITLPSSKKLQPVQVRATPMGLQGFKSGLLFILNEYVKEEKDQEDLKRIISNIK